MTSHAEMDVRIKDIIEKGTISSQMLISAKEYTSTITESGNWRSIQYSLH